MTHFTRLTIVGAVRKAELVIPDDEALGALIPSLMDILGETTGSVARPLTLVRSTGEQLDISLSAAEQQVQDGELLRLVRQDSAPPPPEIADVTDVLADTHADRAGRWSHRSREITGAIAVVVFGAVAAYLSGFAGLVSPALTVGSAIGVLIVTAAVIGRLGYRWVAVALTAGAVGAAVPAVFFAVAGAGLSGSIGAMLCVAGAGAIVWIVIGIGIGIGLADRPARWGSVIGVLLSALPLAMIGSGVGPTETAAVWAVTSVVVCGVLPWVAMSASGLTGLDDQVVSGRLGKRDAVLVTVGGAYQALTWSTFAVAVPLATGAALTIAAVNPWATALGAAVITVTALRTRAFPLTAQVMALWFAALIAAVCGLLLQPAIEPRLALIATLTLATIVAITVAVNPAPHQRAALRRLGNAIETIAVISLFPLLLGAFGIYTDLLGAF